MREPRAVTSRPVGLPWRSPSDEEVRQALDAILVGVTRRLLADERVYPSRGAEQQARIRAIHDRVGMHGWPRPLAVDGHAYHARQRRRRARSRRSR